MKAQVDKHIATLLDTGCVKIEEPQELQKVIAQARKKNLQNVLINIARGLIVML